MAFSGIASTENSQITLMACLLIPNFNLLALFCENPRRFGPGSFQPGSFRPILGVGHFGLGRWVVSANFLGELIRP